MAAWICPRCERWFRRRGQSHECAPAMGLEEYFSTGPEWERPIFEAVLAHLDTLGRMHVEPVSVGIFIKTDGGFVELRSMTRWMALHFPMAYPVDHPRITRKPVRSGRRFHHVVNLSGPEDVDVLVRGWLTESYADHG